MSSQYNQGRISNTIEFKKDHSLISGAEKGSSFNGSGEIRFSDPLLKTTEQQVKEAWKKVLTPDKEMLDLKAARQLFIAAILGLAQDTYREISARVKDEKNIAFNLPSSEKEEKNSSVKLAQEYAPIEPRKYEQTVTRERINTGDGHIKYVSTEIKDIDIVKKTALAMERGVGETLGVSDVNFVDRVKQWTKNIFGEAKGETIEQIQQERKAKLKEIITNIKTRADHNFETDGQSGTNAIG